MATRTLNEICEYLYRLTSSFNAFYSNHEVITEPDETKKESYISLIKLVHDTNKYLLNILAIDVPNKISKKKVLHFLFLVIKIIIVVAAPTPTSSNDNYK